MGNSLVGAQLSIQLNQDEGLICGGSSTKLSGTVYLNVEKSSVTASRLNLKFYGKEATQVEYRHREKINGKTRTTTEYAQEEHTIISAEYILCDFWQLCNQKKKKKKKVDESGMRDEKLSGYSSEEEEEDRKPRMPQEGRVMKGRYEYPFEITLPDGLPGKRGQKRGGSWFVVEYFLEAELYRNEDMLTWEVKTSKEILLADKLHKSAEKTPSFIEPITQPVHFFCCFKTGYITLLANVETTNVFMNDKLKIGYAVRNNSTSRLKAIKVIVRKIQNFHADKHHCVLSSAIYQTRFEDSKGLHTDANIEPLSNGVLAIEADIPNDCPSYNGHLGNVSYIIEVRVCTPTCSMNPEVTIPITLFDNRANYAAIEPVKVPFNIADWHATTIVAKTTIEAPMIAHKWVPITKVAPKCPDLPSPLHSDPDDNESDLFNSPAWSVEMSHIVRGEAFQSPSEPSINDESISSLIENLNKSNQWTESTVLTDWITGGGSIDELIHDLGSVFRCIRGEYSYTVFPKIIGEATKGGLRCEAISKAAIEVPDIHKAAVCYNFSGYCIDKYNARDEFETVGMSTYALMGVLLSYEEGSNGPAYRL